MAGRDPPGPNPQPRIVDHLADDFPRLFGVESHELLGGTLVTPTPPVAPGAECENPCGAAAPSPREGDPFWTGVRTGLHNL